jgi:hypothetical protein
MTKKKSRVNPFTIIVPIIIFLVLGGIIATSIVWITGQTALLTLQRNELKSYMNSTRVTEGQVEVANLNATAQEKQALASEVKSTLYNLSSYPDLSGDNLETVIAFAGENIELANFSYDRRTGTLTFSATSQSVRRMPVFIAALRECGIFSDVQYQGYVNGVRIDAGYPVYDPETDQTTLESYEIDEYRYQVSCLVVNPSATLPALDAPTGLEDAGAAAEGSSE